VAVGLSRPTFERDGFGILSVGGGAADRAAWLLLRGPRTLPVWSGALGSGLHYISPSRSSPVNHLLDGGRKPWTMA
jgi:hypothetical protein